MGSTASLPNSREQKPVLEGEQSANLDGLG
jgi:hypothetical protein